MSGIIYNQQVIIEMQDSDVKWRVPASQELITRLLTENNNNLTQNVDLKMISLILKTIL